MLCEVTKQKKRAIEDKAMIDEDENSNKQTRREVN